MGGGIIFAEKVFLAGNSQNFNHVFLVFFYVKILELQDMSQGPRLTKEQNRVKIVTLKGEGLSLREIKLRTGSDRRTIQRVCKKFRETGSFEAIPNPGRPPLLDDRKKRVIAQILRKNEATNAESIRKEAKAHHEIDVSRDTIARALKSFGFVARIK